MGISFTQRLRPRIASGEVTTSIRLWKSPRVKIGSRHPAAGGWVEITGLTEIDLADVDDDMARASGFENLEDLMSIARHGRGERVFLVEFVFRPG